MAPNLDSVDIKSARILVIDDQPANVKIIEKMLRSEGYSSVSCFTDPREGVNSYQQSPYELVLLDLNMPHMDGFEVMDRLNALTTSDYLSVLVLTAQIDRDTRIRALQAGARDFLNKPFDVVELINRIRNMLEVRMLHHQVRMQNDALEEKIRARTEELEQTRLEIIRRLGRAAEYRDNETGLHIVRMSKMSKLLAVKLGLSKADCDLILNASPMHDVGKIGIPDAILLKPGKLAPAEWQTMQKHPEIGAELLSGHASGLLEAARQIALCHHEKWDGSGYPAGLRAEQIPLFARIVAVADVFDALTSERPYKKAWSLDDAINYLREGAGLHFDPHLIDIFLAHLDEFVAIRERYSDQSA
ncbi:MAG: response regulator [Gammaproteobacteria bacterium]|nr:response regulator [Gammaproteobacteria bacterium]